MATSVRRLQPEDPEQLFRLRRESLIAEPFAFLSSPEDDLASSPQAVRDRLASSDDRTATFGALLGEQLIGMAGLTRDRPIKAAHRACIWGVYVKPEFRRQGVARRLLRAALAHAREIRDLATVYLSVSERKPEAKLLYESVGFVEWGLEPDFIRVAGESTREHHLSLRL